MSNTIRKWSEALGKFFLGMVQTGDIEDGAVTTIKIATGVLVDEKVKATALDPSADVLYNKITVARLIKKVNNVSNVGLELDNINGLSGASLGDDLVLLAERTSDNALYKIAQDALRSWTNRLWLTETLDNNSTVAIPEDTDYPATLISLGSSNSDYMKNKRCVWGYDDSKARFLGRLTGIGRDGWSYTDADLIKLRGERVVISAADYSGASLYEQCWFSILSETASAAWFFKISDYYGTAKQIDYVINAVFEFQYPLSGGNPVTDGRWVLINYECMPAKLWKGTDATIADHDPTFNIFMPQTDKLPHNGYYFFDVFILMTAQYVFGPPYLPVDSAFWDHIYVYLDDADGAHLIRTTPKAQITIVDEDICTVECCCTIIGDHTLTSLHVTGYARIDSADCTNRDLRLRVVRDINYTPAVFTVISTDWTIEWKARKKAAYCNPAATP